MSEILIGNQRCVTHFPWSGHVPTMVHFRLSSIAVSSAYPKMLITSIVKLALCQNLALPLHHHTLSCTPIISPPPAGSALRYPHYLPPPLRYIIECQHGPFRWTIRRRYKHFSGLHKSLRLFRTAMRLPFGTRHHKLRRKTYMARKGKEQPTIPRCVNTIVERSDVSSYLFYEEL